MGRLPRSGASAVHVGYFPNGCAGPRPPSVLFELRNALANAEGITVHDAAIAGQRQRLGFTQKTVGGHRTPTPKSETTTRRQGYALLA